MILVTKKICIPFTEFQSINAAVLKMAGKVSYLSVLHQPASHHENTLEHSSHPACVHSFRLSSGMTLKACFIYLELFAVPRHNLFLLLYGETNNTAFLVCRLITLLATRANNSNHLITGMLRPRINLQPAFQIKICLWFGKHTFDSKYTRVLFVCSCKDFD